jgi:signal transduction histidine kinase
MKRSRHCLNIADVTKDITPTIHDHDKTSSAQEGQLQLSVSDTGVRLPKEKMDQIFSALFTTKPHALSVQIVQV